MEKGKEQAEEQYLAWLESEQDDPIFDLATNSTWLAVYTGQHAALHISDIHAAWYLSKQEK